MKEEKEFRDLVEMIMRMPEEQPPPGFADSVVSSLQPKKLSLWKKLYRKALTPRTITFIPAKLLPAVAVSLALFLALLFNNYPIHRSQVETGNYRLVPIILTLNKPIANKIYAIGSFNGWNPESHEMVIDKESNEWVLKIMLPPGWHEYAFLIDGERVVPDPKAVFTRQDGFGSYNSVIFANSEDEMLL